MYRDDADFKDSYAACENIVASNISQWLDYMIQEEMMSKNNKLCIPKCSMRENLTKEQHSGGISRDFGQDRNFSQVNAFYYWLGMQNQVNNVLEKCIICQHAKGIN